MGPFGRNHDNFDFGFTAPEEGLLLDRLNRFLVKVNVGGRRVDCFMANPARGETLFQRGALVIVQRASAPARKTEYDLVLVREARSWVLVDTRIGNEIVFRALQKKKIPEMAEYDSIRKESTRGRSRFDFHLSGEGSEAYMEVKSVSLAKGGVARFPDGVTERGRKHVEELSEIAARGTKAFIFFLVERDDASSFKPNFAVDPRLSACLLKGIARGVVPLSYGLTCCPEGVRLGRKVAVLASEGGSTSNEGCYHLVIGQHKPFRLRHRVFGGRVFPAGFYVYTGSAKKNLLHRVARHLTQKHEKRWHIDHLLAGPYATILDVAFLPGGEQDECAANSQVGKLEGAVVVRKGFGSSDCESDCPAHLFWFERLPERFLAALPGFGG